MQEPKPIDYIPKKIMFLIYSIVNYFTTFVTISALGPDSISRFILKMFCCHLWILKRLVWFSPRGMQKHPCSSQLISEIYLFLERVKSLSRGKDETSPKVQSSIKWAHELKFDKIKSACLIVKANISLGDSLFPMKQ